MFERSVFVLLGLAIAAVYGVAAATWFGPENLTEVTWVEPVFWALAISGLVLQAILDGYGWLCKHLYRLNWFTQDYERIKPSTNSDTSTSND